MVPCVCLLVTLRSWLQAPLPYPSPNPRVEVAIAHRLFDEDNDERRARGIAVLTWDQARADQAAAWSRDHLPSTGDDPPGTEANVIGRGGCPTDGRSTCYATVSLPTDGTAHVGWMASAGHRANILDPGAAAEGVGVFCGPHGILYATEIFAPVPGAGAEPAAPATPVADAGTGGMTCNGWSR